jgi:chromate reductase
MQLAPPEFEMKEIAFAELPLYSYDYGADFPPTARAFTQCHCGGRCGACSLRSKYNRSIPGELKNAIDWASRPYGKNSFNPQAVDSHWRMPGSDRNGGGATWLHSALSSRMYCKSCPEKAEAHHDFGCGCLKPQQSDA